MKQKVSNKPVPHLTSAELESIRQEFEAAQIGCKPRLNLVVIGHVDAGKSTLVGHLLYKLGKIDKRQMHRLETDSQRSGKGSFKFAWAMDETDDERSRGVTIDLAMRHFETPHRQVVLLDAPGHMDFVPAVISGASQADCALLVLDATRGEFETGFSHGGQTREHTHLVRSLGIRSLVVAINKMDNVDWNIDRFEDIISQIVPFLKQAGYLLDTDVQFVACSGILGDNLTQCRFAQAAAKKASSSHPQLEQDMTSEASRWEALALKHKIRLSLSLVEAIDKIEAPERPVDKPTRVCVTDVYKTLSSAVQLCAKLVSGRLQCKQRLLVMPINEFCEVKQLEVDSDSVGGGGGRLDGDKGSRAFAGDIVNLSVVGVDLCKFYRGCVLCEPMVPCKSTNRIQGRLLMLPASPTDASGGALLIKGSPVEMHINGNYESGRVRRLVSQLNRNTGERLRLRPRLLTANSSGIVRIELDRPVCCELYSDNKQLGRFMLRACGKTIAAGVVTRLWPTKVSRGGVAAAAGAAVL